jgi:hypothetical protein
LPSRLRQMEIAALNSQTLSVERNVDLAKSIWPLGSAIFNMREANRKGNKVPRPKKSITGNEWIKVKLGSLMATTYQHFWTSGIGQRETGHYQTIIRQYHHLLSPTATSCMKGI